MIIIIVLLLVIIRIMIIVIVIEGRFAITARPYALSVLSL